MFIPTNATGGECVIYACSHGPALITLCPRMRGLSSAWHPEFVYSRLKFHPVSDGRSEFYRGGQENREGSSQNRSQEAANALADSTPQIVAAGNQRSLRESDDAGNRALIPCGRLGCLAGPSLRSLSRSCLGGSLSLCPEPPHRKIKRYQHGRRTAAAARRRAC
jgi:hypothetical protein